MALAQDLDPNRLLPSPPGVGDAAPAAVFATMGVFTGFSPEVPGAKDPLPIVPWDDDGDSGSDDAMDDFDEAPRELFADDEEEADAQRHGFDASERHQQYLQKVQLEKQRAQQEELLRAKKEVRRRKKKQATLLAAAEARKAMREVPPPAPVQEEVEEADPAEEQLANEPKVPETRRRQKQQYKRLMKTLALKRRQDLASAEDDKAKEDEFKRKVRENGLRRARQRREEALKRKEELGDVVADVVQGSAAKAASLLKQAERNVLEKQNVLTDEDFLNAEEAKEALKRKRAEQARLRQERTRLQLEKIAADKRAKVEAEQKKAQRLLRRQELLSERVLNRERPKELAGEDKENEPVRKVAAKEEAPAKPVLTEEEKERRRLRREQQAEAVARLNKVSEKDQPTGAVGRDFKDYKRKLGLSKDTKVFCMTGWYPCVKDALLERGWHFNDDRESTFYDLKWTLRSNDIDKGIKPNQLTNHFLKNTAITTKAGLTRSLCELHWHCDDHSDHVYPRAYDLSSPHSFRGFLDDFRGLEAEKCLKNVIRSLSSGDESSGDESSEEDSSDSEVTDPAASADEMNMESTDDVAEAPAPAPGAEAPAPADDASDIDSLEMDELDGVLGDKEAPLLFNEELLRIALRVCRKKLRVLVDDDTELDGCSGYSDRLVTDLEW